MSDKEKYDPDETYQFPDDFLPGDDSTDETQDGHETASESDSESVSIDQQDDAATADAAGTETSSPSAAAVNHKPTTSFMVTLQEKVKAICCVAKKKYCAYAEQYSFLKNTRMMIGVLICVILLIIVSIMSLESSKSPESNLPQANQALVPQQTKQQQMTSAVNNQLAPMRNTQNELQSSMGQMKSQISQVSASMQSMQQTQQGVVKALSQLAIQMKLLSKDIEKPSIHSKIFPNRPLLITYQLKAVIPGRAWLAGSNGKTTTVAIGDTLPRYGEVKEIDTTTGKVIFKSGKVIGYGRFDH